MISLTVRCNLLRLSRQVELSNCGGNIRMSLKGKRMAGRVLGDLILTEAELES